MSFDKKESKISSYGKFERTNLNTGLNIPILWNKKYSLHYRVWNLMFWIGLITFVSILIICVVWLMIDASQHNWIVTPIMPPWMIVLCVFASLGFITLIICLYKKHKIYKKEEKKWI